jgi:hypothetical protein
MQLFNTLEALARSVQDCQSFKTKYPNIESSTYMGIWQQLTGADWAQLASITIWAPEVVGSNNFQHFVLYYDLDKNHLWFVR